MVVTTSFISGWAAISPKDGVVAEAMVAGFSGQRERKIRGDLKVKKRRRGQVF